MPARCASAGVDARTNLENDVAHGNLASCQSADLDDALQTHAGVLVQLLQTMEGQNAVLAHHRHNIGSDAHSAEVE